MRKVYLVLLALPLIIGATKTNCKSETSVNTAQNLIPKPVSLVEKGGAPFVFKNGTTFNFAPTGDAGIDAQLERIGALFSEMVSPAFGFGVSRGSSFFKKDLQFVIDPDFTAAEGYSLDVAKSKITIRAATPAGIFYGTQTIFQLLPAEVKSAQKVDNVKWEIPAVTIEDEPRFVWRGSHMDPVRHFYTLEQLRTHIDRMAEYKFNKLHLHFTDDQGWRVEIKAMPELTEKLAYRPTRVGDYFRYDDPKPGEPFDYGGYYTQDELRELVKYAAERYIEIVPEIDVPGHSLALMVAHPELHCTGNPGEYLNIGNRANWNNSSLCIGNPKTMEVLEVIYGELAQIFPSKYMHMGGDEARKANWEACPKCQAVMKEEGFTHINQLQSYFTKQMNAYITSLGKTMVGWDEIIDGGLASDAVVMSWRGMEGGKVASSQGHEVIMNPKFHCYLDLYQGDPAIEPLTIEISPLRWTYEWDPVPENISDPKLILGTQCNLWSERITTQSQMEYMLNPRFWSIAEVAWTPQELREWTEFFPRLEHHMRRADFAGINYAVSAYNAWMIPFAKDGKVYIDFYKDLDDVDIYYTIDNTIPDIHSPKYDGVPFSLDGTNSSKINVQTYRDGKPVGKLFRVTRDEINNRAKWRNPLNFPKE